jgi:NAD(P)-dependent dehydrogenase (short-subunit alcohol dehydrogenase family)
MPPISNRIAWITGGGTGIGRATALRLARDGWQVAISGRREEPLNEVVSTAGELEGRILPVPVDVTDRDACVAAAERIEAELGPLHLVILNAGTFTKFNAIKDFDATAFDTHYAVNFFGVINGINAALPLLKQRRSGHIVIISSVSGYRGLPLAAPYGSSKAALIHLAESLRFDLEPAGIDVTVVNPGFVETPLTEQNRFPMPALTSTNVAADRIVKGIYRRRFEVTFPRRLTYFLKLMRMLPYAVYFPIMRAFTRR